MKADYIPEPLDNFYLLNTDISSLYCPHSECLAERRHVYKSNNKVKGNRPVEIGYELSTIGLSTRRPLYGVSEPAWNPPLSMRLVPWGENKNVFTANQVNELLDNRELPFHNLLTVNALDSSYCTPEYVVGTYQQKNLVNIIRSPSNRNVYKQLNKEEVIKCRMSNEDHRGANRVYGAEYKLNQSESWDLEPDRVTEFGVKLANGKQVIVSMKCWEDLLVRTQRGYNMKDKPFDLVQIRMLDPVTRVPVFKKCMWLRVWGERRKELSLEQIYWAYRNRYDIEHFFRLGKQRLLLDKFQTPEEENLENWMEIVNTAYWLLFVGREQATHQCHKWQQYDKNYKNRQAHQMSVTPSQVQNQMASIILGFDQTDFLPKARKKGKGRAIGTTLTKRKKYPVLKKKRKRKRQKKR